MARDVAGVAAGMALLEPGFSVASTSPRTVGVLALDADPLVTAAIDDALRTAEFDVVPVTIPDLDQVIVASLTVLNAQAWQANKDLFAAAADQIGGDVRDRLKQASTITPAQVTEAEAVIARWRETLDGLWHRVDAARGPHPPRIPAAARRGAHPVEAPRAHLAGERGRCPRARAARPGAGAGRGTNPGERPADRPARQRGATACRRRAPRAGGAWLRLLVCLRRICLRRIC